MMALRETQASLQAWIFRGDTGHLPKVADPLGLDIYYAAYRARLREAVSETFEKSRAWLGDEVFDAVVADYISANPPTHWSLSEYGETLPRWFARTFADDPEIGELAAIEWALHHCFSGAEGEPFDWAGIAGLDWENAVITLVPTYAEVEMRTNAATIWRTMADGVEPPEASLLPERVKLRFWRRGHSPNYVAMDRFEAQALNLIQQSLTFSAVCASLETSFPDADIARKVGDLLVQWRGDGLILLIG
jgi:Putative DNA-binding domain